MTAIIDFVNNFVTIIWNFGTWLFEIVISLIAFLIMLVLKLAFKIVILVLSGLDLPSYMLDYTQIWGLLPCQVVWIINACGLPQGLGMIGVALMVRFTINLIPAEFTRV